MDVLEAEKLAFAAEASTEAAEGAVVAQDPVAGYDDWDGVVSKGVGDSARGAGFGDLIGDPAVGASFAPGYVTASGPHVALEGSWGCSIERYRGEGGRCTAEVGSEEAEQGANEKGGMGMVE